MPFSTFGGQVVISAQGKPSYLFMVRNDMNQIVAVDTESVAPLESVVRWRQFDGGDPTTRKKLVLIEVYGTGTLPTPAGLNGNCLMIVTADQNHSQTYSYTPAASSPSERILWRQGIQSMSGRTFDIALFIRGGGVEINKVEIQFTVQ